MAWAWDRLRGRTALALFAVLGAIVLALVAPRITSRRVAGATRVPVALPGENPEIDVALTAWDDATVVPFSAPHGWSATIASSTSAATETVSLSPSGRLRLGRTETDLPEIRIEAERGAPITVGNSRYAGSLRIRASNGALRVINRVPLERYLASVVGSEMAAGSVPAAALEAQAIAARTYARWEIEERGRFPIPDSQDAQVYAGLSRETASTRGAAESTKGLVLRFGAEILPAFYHSTCGGRTIDGSDLLGSPAPAPLHGVTCVWCEGAKLYRWSVPVTLAMLSDVARALRLGTQIRQIERKGPSSAPWESLKLTGDRASAVITARAFRTELRRATRGPTLPSPFLEEIAGDTAGISVRGRGFGHGVGLCQMGAASQARRGKNAREILSFYYPGASIEPATAPIAASQR